VDWRLGRRTWEVLAPTGGSALKRQANRVAAAAGAQSPLINPVPNGGDSPGYQRNKASCEPEPVVMMDLAFDGSTCTYLHTTTSSEPAVQRMFKVGVQGGSRFGP